MTPTISPTRHYVIVCHKINFDGHYFKSFYLPEVDPYPVYHVDGFRLERTLLNNSDMASWFFLNRLDFGACVSECFTWEDFQDIRPVRQDSDPKLASA